MNNDDELRAVNAILQQLLNLGTDARRGAGYLARQEIERIKSQLAGRPSRLEHYGFKVYSQNDEDGIIDEIFRRLSVSSGTFCEIGVENGLECNTLFLLHKGWRGCWLEGDLRHRVAIESKFRPLFEARRLCLRMGLVTPENINEAMAQTLAPLAPGDGQIDFLSIDIDGMDIYLLESLRCRPKVICIEYNAKFPPPLRKRPAYDPQCTWTGTDYMGSSLSALTEVATGLGYSLVGTNVTGLNAFYVRDDLILDRFDRPMSPEALYNPPRYYLTDDHYHRGVGHPPDFGRYTDLA